ncbi:MAG: DUF3084 domain-containing protein [Candidatus Margulisiibacteriota bacterium]
MLLLLLLGGIIAYLGNYIGRYIGKRRLTIFGLRPRYTATAIAVFSGVLIAFFTLLILLLVSQDARMAIFGLEELRKEIKIKSEELEKTNFLMQEKLLAQKALEEKLRRAKEELKSIQVAKEKLRREVLISRHGQILFKIGEVVTQSLIQGGPERTKIETGLRQILSAADANLRSFGVKSEKHLIYMSPENFEEAVSLLLKESRIYIVRLIATRNVLWGEEIPARFEILENNLIYKEGAEIAAGEILPNLTIAEIEQEIMKLLQASHQAARGAGILPDIMGSVGSIPYLQISEVAKKIKANDRKVILRVVAAGDIYRIGPLEVKFKLSYQ